MKTVLSLASLLLLGAQAINVAQTDASVPASEQPEEGDDMMLTTYIGFEFEGAELAEKFQSLSPEEQEEVRQLV